MEESRHRGRRSTASTPALRKSGEDSSIYVDHYGKDPRIIGMAADNVSCNVRRYVTANNCAGISESG